MHAHTHTHTHQVKKKKDSDLRPHSSCAVHSRSLITCLRNVHGFICGPLYYFGMKFNSMDVSTAVQHLLSSKNEEKE